MKTFFQQLVDCAEYLRLPQCSRLPDQDDQKCRLWTESQVATHLQNIAIRQKAAVEDFIEEVCFKDGEGRWLTYGDGADLTKHVEVMLGTRPRENEGDKP